MKPIKSYLLEIYKENIAKECIDASLIPAVDEEGEDNNELIFFTDGVENGMREIISCLKLHGHIEIEN